MKTLCYSTYAYEDEKETPAKKSHATFTFTGTRVLFVSLRMFMSYLLLLGIYVSVPLLFCMVNMRPFPKSYSLKSRKEQYVFS